MLEFNTMEHSLIFYKVEGYYTIFKIVDISRQNANGTYPILIKKFFLSINHDEKNINGPIPTRNGYKKILDMNHDLNVIKISVILLFLLKGRDPYKLEFFTDQYELVIQNFRLHLRSEKLARILGRINQNG